MRVRRTTVTILCCAVLPLTGCGEEPRADPPAAPTTSTASPVVSEEPSDPGNPPASGITIEGDQYRVTIPKGWKADEELLGVVFTYNPDNTDVIAVTSVDGATTSLDEAARIAVKGSGVAGTRRVDDTTLGGLPAYHLTATPVGEKVYEEFGVSVGNQLVSIAFDIRAPDGERQALMNSVLTTFEWK